MLTSLYQDKARPAKPLNVLSPYAKHLNMGSLAIILIVGLAIITSMRGKSPDVTNSTSGGTSDTRVVSCANK